MLNLQMYAIFTFNIILISTHNIFFIFLLIYFSKFSKQTFNYFFNFFFLILFLKIPNIYGLFTFYYHLSKFQYTLLLCYTEEYTKSCQFNCFGTVFFTS